MKLFRRYLCRDWLVLRKMNFLFLQKIIPAISYAILMCPRDSRFTENKVRKNRKYYLRAD